MRIAIYSRKSKFTGKGESIENQIEMCYDYIYSHFPEASQEDISVFEDEGFSGKSLNRPQFKNLMEIEKKVPFDVIVVYRLDRISRNVGDFAGLIDRLNSYKTAFVSIKEQFDTSTPMGRAMMNIAAVFAQLERETIAERVKDNMYMLAKTGRWLGGTTPLGFDSEKVDYIDDKGVSRKCYKLTENPSQIEKVRIIYKKFIELRSMNKLETYLLNHGITTQNDCQFYVSTIRNILTNPVYCTADPLSYDYFNVQGCDIAAAKNDCNGSHGFIGYSKTETSGSGERIANDRSEWIIAIGKHQGIISSTDWIEVQNILNENADSKVRFKQSHNPVALLSGILFCSCGSYMRPKYYRVNKKGVKPYAYMCELKERSKKGKCSCSNLNGMAADKLICDILLNYDIPDNIFNKYLEKLSGLSVTANTEELIKNQEAIKAKKQKEISSLIKVLTTDVDKATIRYINKEISKINDDIAAADKEIKRLRLIESGHKESHRNFDTVKKAFDYFKSNFDNLSTDHKRRFIRQNIKKVVWDGTTLNIFVWGRRSDSTGCLP
ncbi:MAG: recombinase family protein [Oscillospiraceae bacterium]|nr:recombinase family protein [Oscillospiraceae bacterium]